MLTWYRFFDKCVLRGFIDKIPIFYVKKWYLAPPPPLIKYPILAVDG